MLRNRWSPSSRRALLADLLGRRRQLILDAMVEERTRHAITIYEMEKLLEYRAPEAFKTDDSQTETTDRADPEDLGSHRREEALEGTLLTHAAELLADTLYATQAWTVYNDAHTET